MKFKKLVLINLISIVFLVGTLSSCNISDKFILSVNESGNFKNTFETIKPQTFVHNYVLEHFDGALAEGKKYKKALILFMDGARADCIDNILQSDVGVGYLAKQGETYLTYTGNEGKFKPDSSTAITSVLTGDWSNIYGVVKPTDAKGIEPLTLISKVAQRNKKTAIYSSNESLIKVQLKAEKDWSQNYKATFEEETNDQILQRKLIRNIGSFDLTVGVYQDIVLAGKEHGFGSNKELYINSIERLNDYAAEVISSIKNGENYQSEDWLILIGSSFGGEKDKTHSSNKPEVRTGWLATNKIILNN